MLPANCTMAYDLDNLRAEAGMLAIVSGNKKITPRVGPAHLVFWGAGLGLNFYFFKEFD